MPVNKSVGDQADNETGDALFVQLLLADWLTRRGDPPISVDGQVGPKTIAAIKTFQEAETGLVDGVVDPGGAAIKKLEKLHIQGLSQNEISSFPPYQPLIGVPATPLPPGTTADPFFEQYLQILRDGLE